MRTIHYETAITLAVGLLVATGGVTEAMPTYGIGNCISCHTTPGGGLTTSPDPLEAMLNSNNTLTFNILELPGEGAIALTGLDASGLDATVGSGWTFNPSGYYYSDHIEDLGPVTLDLSIGPAAIVGDYGIGLMFVGEGEGEDDEEFRWGTATGFMARVRNIPEPASIVLFFFGIGYLTLTYGLSKRKRRKEVSI